MSNLLERSPDSAEPGRRGPRLAVIAAVAGVLALLLAWLVAFSPLLGARSVSIRGNRTVSSAAVQAAAAVGHGTPLIRLNTNAVRQRVEAIPYIASATVTVSYPSTVVITVQERNPVGYLVIAGGYLLVDKTGTQFVTVTARPAKLPRFDVPGGAVGRAAGQAVAVVAGALPAAVLSELASIQADSPDAITLMLADGRMVEWGSADASGEKAAMLTAVLRQPGRTFDLTSPGLVVAH
ncbi:MAG TPA: FtsQ-type POTRA domain-containing protein [Jatrophihabitantaceae bacterium]|nr:FtsQ-type POTRA domain-containing protein [Jatrophihabitantaceae bacterium]